MSPILNRSKTYYAASLFGEPTGNPRHLQCVLLEDHERELQRVDAHMRKLHAENVRLREALEKIGTDFATFEDHYADGPCRDAWGTFLQCKAIARAALAPTEADDE